MRCLARVAPPPKAGTLGEPSHHPESGAERLAAHQVIPFVVTENR
jgi:hypothetical protein